MINFNKLETLCDMLSHLNHTYGQHRATVEIIPGMEHGRVNLQLNWGKENLEIEFEKLDEAISKTQETIKGINLEQV